jgi:type I restriction enzyme R subunit
MDAESIEVIRQLGLELDLPDRPEPPTAEQVLDSIEARLARRLSGPHHPVYDSLATRLDDLRRQRLASAEESVEFLKRLLEIARDVVAADKADDEGRVDEVAPALLDPRIGALTQIFREYAPDATPQIIATVVHDIDEIVRQVRFAGWQQTAGGDRDVRRELRKTLNKHGLGTSGPVFDRAYAYIRANY